MKYIKLFESEYKGDFWLIRADDPYLSISIDKLKLPLKQKNYLKNNGYINGKDTYYDFDHNNNGEILKIKKVYIPDANFDVGKYSASWMPYKENDNKYAFETFETMGLVYKGEVEVEDWEVEAYKYNL